MATCTVALITRMQCIFCNRIELVKIRATEQVAILFDAEIRVNFLTFSAALGKTRTSSVLRSLARKFVRFVGKKIIRGPKKRIVDKLRRFSTFCRLRRMIMVDFL